MLPFSSVPSIQEKLKGHQYREEHFDDTDAIEEERIANFGITSRNRWRQPTYAELLLGPDFHETNADVSTDHKSAVTIPHQSAEHEIKSEKCGASDPSPTRSQFPDWTVRPLSSQVQAELKNLQRITGSVPAANGSTYDVDLDQDSIERILGSTSVDSLSWLDDNTVNCFTSLINARSKRMAAGHNEIHRPSNNKNIFDRNRVRVHIFGTHFFEILSRKTNGGYEGVKKWRRKIRDYNSIGVYMFPAFIRGNHWVLAVVDIDGRQLIYYDPYGASDDQHVMRFALSWVSGEVQRALRRDVFKGLDPKTWPVLVNPGNLPLQTDVESCGIFVLFVAEHFERVVRPSFQQSHIPVLRFRALWILKEKVLHDTDE